MIVELSRIIVVAIILDSDCSSVVLLFIVINNTIRTRLPQLATSTGFIIKRASPQFETFNPCKEQWNSWSRRFDQWLLLSSFSGGDNAEAKKRAAFCTYIGSETFTLLCSLCAPGKPEDKTYEELKEKLDKQYGVKNWCLLSVIVSIRTNNLRHNH